MQQEAELLAAVQLGIELKGPSNQWFSQLEEQIRQYLLQDFNRLVNILYRMDVSEDRLRLFLHREAGTDSARVITTLLVERQLQRIRSRMDQSMEESEEDEEDEERW